MGRRITIEMTHLEALKRIDELETELCRWKEIANDYLKELEACREEIRILGLPPRLELQYRRAEQHRRED